MCCATTSLGMGMAKNSKHIAKWYYYWVFFIYHISENLFFRCRVPIFFTGKHVNMNKTLPVCPNDIIKEIMEKNYDTDCSDSIPCEHTKYQIKEFNWQPGNSHTSILSLEYSQEFGENQNTYVSVDEQTLISKIGGLIGITFGLAGLNIMPLMNYVFNYMIALAANV